MNKINRNIKKIIQLYLLPSKYTVKFYYEIVLCDLLDKVLWIRTTINSNFGKSYKKYQKLNRHWYLNKI